MSAGLLALTSGGSGLALAYGISQASVLAGLFWGGRKGHGRNLFHSPWVALGAMAASGAAMSFAKPLILGMGIASGGFGHFGIALAVNIGVGFLAGRYLAGRQGSGDVHRRGTIVLDERQAAAARRQQASAVKRERLPGHEQRLPTVTFAGMPLLRNDESLHFKIIGTTGSGKSTAIKELIDAALARGDRAIIADPEGDYIKRYYDPARGDKIMNPFDSRSVSWDLFAEIRHRKDIDDLAFSLIPETGSAAAQEWREYARTFFIAVTNQLWEAGNKDKEATGKSTSQYHTIAELYKTLTTDSVDSLRELLCGTAAEPFLNEENGRMFGSIRAITGSLLRAFEHLGKTQGEKFSVGEWVAQGRAGHGPKEGGVLFIPYKAGEISALKSTISTWMRLGIFAAMEKEQDKDQRLWFVIDELDALGRINGLKDALVRLRKFGGRSVLGFQSIAQVADTYGQGEGQTMVENCRNTLILNSSNSQGGGTSEFASRLIGEREGIRTTSSKSRQDGRFFGSTTHAEQYYKEAAVMASQIDQLQNLSGYMRVPSRSEWMQVRLRHQDHAPCRAETFSAANAPDSTDELIEKIAAEKAAELEWHLPQTRREEGRQDRKTDRGPAPKGPAAGKPRSMTADYTPDH